MTDKEYIKGLEYLVNSLANIYQFNFNEFKYNDNFTTYQGEFRDSIKQVSNIEIKQPEKLTETVGKYLKDNE